jgi:hypothetical protein
MPTDEARRTTEISAPFERVLGTVHDVRSQVEWVAEIREIEILETLDEGTVDVARVTAAAPVGTDEYTLRYERGPEGISWSLVSGRLQTGQDGRYTLEALPDARTRVTYSLRISHHLPLPGFVRQRVVNGLVDSALKGLKGRLEAA